jgi:hypothetical protein
VTHADNLPDFVKASQELVYGSDSIQLYSLRIEEPDLLQGESYWIFSAGRALLSFETQAHVAAPRQITLLDDKGRQKLVLDFSADGAATGYSLYVYPNGDMTTGLFERWTDYDMDGRFDSVVRILPDRRGREIRVGDRWLSARGAADLECEVQGEGVFQAAQFRGGEWRLGQLQRSGK